jgi:hypothetical protein
MMDDSNLSRGTQGPALVGSGQEEMNGWRKRGRGESKDGLCLCLLCVFCALCACWVGQDNHTTRNYSKHFPIFLAAFQK